jgi:hypothetical protein
MDHAPKWYDCGYETMNAILNVSKHMTVHAIIKLIKKAYGLDQQCIRGTY